MDQEKNLQKQELPDTSPSEIEDTNILHNHLRDFEKPQSSQDGSSAEESYPGLEVNDNGGPEELPDPEPITIEDLEKGKTPKGSSESKENKKDPDHGRHIQNNTKGKPTAEGMKLFQDLQVLKDMYARIKNMEDGPKKEKAMDKFDRVAGFDTGIKAKGKVNMKQVEAVLLGATSTPIFEGEKNQEQASVSPEKILEEENQRWQEENKEKVKKAEEHGNKVRARRDIILDKQGQVEEQQQQDEQRREEVEEIKRRKQRKAEDKAMAEKEQKDKKEMDDLRRRIADSAPKAEKAKEEENKVIGEAVERLKKEEQEKEVNGSVGKKAKTSEKGDNPEISSTEQEEDKEQEGSAVEPEQEDEENISLPSSKPKPKEKDLKDVQIRTEKKTGRADDIRDLKTRVKTLESEWKKFGGDKAKEIENEILALEDEIRKAERQTSASEGRKDEISELKEEISHLEQTWKTKKGDEAKNIEENILEKEDKIREVERKQKETTEASQTEGDNASLAELNIHDPDKDLDDHVKGLESEEVDDPEYEGILQELNAGNLDDLGEISSIRVVEAKALAGNLKERPLVLDKAREIGRNALLVFLNEFKKGADRALILVELKTVDGQDKLDDDTLKILSDFPKNKIFLPDDIKKQIDAYERVVAKFTQSDEDNGEPLKKAA